MYAVEGTTANEWLERRLAGKKASPSDPRLLHGFLTYDYFSIFRLLDENGTGGQWYRGDKWMPIRFPMAFVILGPTDVVPWEEQVALTLKASEATRVEYAVRVLQAAFPLRRRRSR